MVALLRFRLSHTLFVVAPSPIHIYHYLTNKIAIII